ncbi:MAG: protein kinase [Acidobacteria bacterium]|nr:protein kinase [Acidobacteriota bacterium]
MKECSYCKSCYNDEVTFCLTDGSPLQYTLPTNTLLDSNYQLTKLISRGSMGSVYQAQQEDLQRSVAIKILNPQLVSNDVARERFRREALAAASMKHPNIITVYDFSSSPTGLVYIVMELLEGRTLTDRFLTEPRLSINDSVKIILEICEALSQAHSRGIIHRDLKPSNIFLCKTSTGEVSKIIDFGLVKLKERTIKSITSGALIGSLHYTAPEQFRTTEVDARADIYSLGTIFYQMLTGRPPFDTANKADLIYQQLNLKPTQPHKIVFDIPPALETTLMKTLEKDPDLRYQSIEDFAKALKQAPKRNVRSTVGMFVSLPLDYHNSLYEKELPKLVEKEVSFDHFVARNRERTKLRQAFEQVNEGKAIVLLISGDPGIGKSKLLSQAIKEFQEIGALCFSGQFTSQITPLWSILDLRAYLQKLVLEKEHFQNIFGSIANSLEEEISQLPKMSTAALFQSKLENRLEKSSDLITQAIVRLSQKYPLVIAIDDLHLADETNLNLLMHLVRLAANSQILFIFTARTQDLVRPENLVANCLDRISNQRQLQRLNLSELTKADIRSFIEKIFEPISISEESIEKLSQATEGNPFYLTNVLQLMLEEGAITWEEKTWLANIIEIKIPETVTQLIEARLSFLPLEKRQVLEKATILGETFGFETLKKFTDIEEDTLLKIIDDSLRYGLLKEIRTPEDTFVEDDYYSFTQHILYKSLYNLWSTNERKELHRKLAEILIKPSEESSQNNLAAQQFELAEELPLAFCQYTLAANQAWRSGEVNLVKKLLKKTQTISEKIINLDNLLNQSLELDEETEKIAAYYCDYLILSVDLKLCDLAQAEEWIEIAVRLAQRLNDLILFARVLVAAGYFQQSQADYIGALNYFERALAIYDQTGNKSRYNIILEQINSLRIKTKPQKPTADIF